MTRGALAAFTFVAILVTPRAALAHGIGERADLPLPLAYVSYAAGVVLLLSFAALAWLWPASRWERGITGVALPRWLDRALDVLAWPVRLVGLFASALVVYAAFTAPDDPQRNIAPIAVYVLLWVGFLFASGFIGDLWRAIGPVPTLGRLLGPRREYTHGHWPAAIGLTAFTWLELVHPNAASPRVVAVAIGVYLVITVAALLTWGRDWARHGDPFGAIFAVVAAMAPFYADDDGRLRVRPPLVGLSALRPVRGTVALVVVALGSTTYDGLSRTRLWTRLIGEGSMVVSTLGLLWTIGAVYALYRIAVAAMPALAGVPREDRDPDETAADFVHSLVPIALAYVVAHYFSLLAFEGQTALALASDPLGRGWNLFGTAEWEISYSALQPRTIAYVQTAAIVLGHVAGVVLAHDRAVSRYPVKVASKTQYPLLAVMVAYTVGALVILLGG